MHQSQPPLANVSSFLPSPADLLMAVPRLLSKAGALGEHIDGVFGKIRSGGSVIAQPTVANLTNASSAATSATFVQESLAAAAGAGSALQEDMGLLQALKNVGSFFSYITSKWAIATFAIAILLNRTHFYASSRVPLPFGRLHLRFALYLAPMLLFMYRIRSVLQAIRCQTDPAWSSMQYGAPGRQLDVDFAGDGGFLWRASSMLLFWQDVEDSCKAVHMFPTEPDIPRPAGSLALLWPVFISLGFGQFIDHMSCALHGRQPTREVGMTIFEHSLAFAEAEAVVTRPLTLDSTRFFKPKVVFTPDATALILSRSTISAFANVPPELLLISLISTVSHFTSNLLAVAGYRANCRLVTTGLSGAAYMATFAWSLLRLTTTSPEVARHTGILRFPTVCIVGFIPHLVIIMGILCCGAIYSLAFVFTVFSLPHARSGNMTWKERVATAYGNLQANIHLSAITPLRINWNEDFYTAVLKVGLTVLTAASEAVYLNEAPTVNVHSLTWLEKKQLQDILARRRQARQRVAPIPVELSGDILAQGVDVVDSPSAASVNSSSGYAQERKARVATTTSDTSAALGRDAGVGLRQRRGRWALTYRFLRGILMLLIIIQAKLLVAVIQKLHIPYSPQWLVRLAGPRADEKPRASASGSVGSRVAEEKTRLLSDRADVETYARERMHELGVYEQKGPSESEEYLSTYLYNWWKGGGRWGDVDTSGDYVPAVEDDDTTSVVSYTSISDADEWSEMEDDGQRTPTQEAYQYSRESTPMQENTLDLAHLSHLLDPKSKEDREEARLLARHLQSSGVLTRSQYRTVLEREEARILTTSRNRVVGFPGTAHMSPEEEEHFLEEFVLDKRETSGKSNAGSWDSGAEGMGAEGPQCVVCQLSPRTVLVWPCGCLSLCDECRVGLASKNYTTCVCCRTNVVAYSRLYVP